MHDRSALLGRYKHVHWSTYAHKISRRCINFMKCNINADNGLKRLIACIKVCVCLCSTHLEIVGYFTIIIQHTSRILQVICSRQPGNVIDLKWVHENIFILQTTLYGDINKHAASHFAEDASVTPRRFERWVCCSWKIYPRRLSA